VIVQTRRNRIYQTILQRTRPEIPEREQIKKAGKTKIGAERGSKEDAMGERVKKSALGPLRRLSSELRCTEEERDQKRRNNAKETGLSTEGRDRNHRD
jgi:hypothetical protein